MNKIDELEKMLFPMTHAGKGRLAKPYYEMTQKEKTMHENKMSEQYEQAIKGLKLFAKLYPKKGEELEQEFETLDFDSFKNLKRLEDRDLTYKHLQGLTEQVKAQKNKIECLEQELREADNFEDDLISQLRASHYYASNQDDICDDMAGAIRLLNKVSANNTLNHTDALMLKAIVKVALNMLDKVDTESVANYL
jgi:hypothetical protein